MRLPNRKHNIKTRRRLQEIEIKKIEEESLNYIPRSQCTESIGYPATGHFTIKSVPDMPVIFGISRINGRP